MSDLKLNIGNNAQYLFSALATDGTTAVPLTGLSKATFSILATDELSYLLQLDNASKPLQVIPDIPNGTVTVKVLPANSTGFIPGNYKYDLALEFTDGTKLTLVSDYLDITNVVTASITVPPTPRHLTDITVDMVKTHFGIPAETTAKDPQIAQMIPAVIDYVKAYTRRDWVTKYVVESTNALGPVPTMGPANIIDYPVGAEVYESPRLQAFQTSFFTKFRPLKAGTIEVYEDTRLCIENVDYLVFHETGEIRKLVNYMFAIYPTYGNNFWYVNYSYWISFPGKIQIRYQTGNTPPQDLIYAALEIIGIRAGLKTRTYVDGQGVAQSVLMTEIPKEIKEILNLHRKARV